MSSASRFVIVEIPVKKAVSKLIEFLETNDFTDFVCTPHISTHRSVQKYIQDEISKIECANCKPAKLINPNHTPVEKPELNLQTEDQYQSISPQQDGFLSIDMPIQIKRELTEEEAEAEHDEWTERTIKREKQKYETPILADNDSSNVTEQKMEASGLSTAASVSSMDFGHFDDDDDFSLADHMLTLNSYKEENDFVQKVERDASPPVVILKRRSSISKPKELSPLLEKPSKIEKEQRLRPSTDKRLSKDKTKNEKCMICFKSVGLSTTKGGDIAFMLQHAKTHSELKQYSCTFEGCDFLSHGSGNVAAHMKSIHNVIGTAKSTLTDELRQSWVESFRRCFPKHEHEADQMKCAKEIGRLDRTVKPETPQSEKLNRSFAQAAMKCTVCRKMVLLRKKQNARYSLLRHAKTHCSQHQFECTVDDCDYSSCENSNCMRHMKELHQIDGLPKDKLTEELKQAWNETLQKCFPNYEAHII